MAKVLMDRQPLDNDELARIRALGVTMETANEFEATSPVGGYTEAPQYLAVEGDVDSISEAPSIGESDRSVSNPLSAKRLTDDEWNDILTKYGHIGQEEIDPINS